MPAGRTCRMQLHWRNALIAAPRENMTGLLALSKLGSNHCRLRMGAFVVPSSLSRSFLEKEVDSCGKTSEVAS